MLLIRPMTVSDGGAFTRASVGTYYNQVGLIAEAAVNAPRFNFEPSDLTRPPVLLMELAATNLLTKSEDLSVWTLNAATVAADATTAPNGLVTADLLYPSATLTGAHSARRTSVTVTAGAVVGASVYLRSGGLTRAAFHCENAAGTDGLGMVINLLTGEIENTYDFGAGVWRGVAKVTKLPGSWLRCEVIGAIVGATSYDAVVYAGDPDVPSSGDGVVSVGVWGAQIELDAVTSYIKTDAATATRAIDVNTSNMLSNVAETEPVWSSLTTYAKEAKVRGTGADAHNVFLSLQNTNLNKPLTDPAWWLKIGATNRWKMYDQAVNSQTGNNEFIAATIRTTGRIDSVVLLNVSAANVRITMVDNVEGTVYDKTFSLIATAGINNWWAYYYEPITRAKDIAILDLPPFANATVTVTLSDPGSYVTCGACIIGLSTDIGSTQYGAQVGIQDYSIKQRDDYGNLTILERAFSDRGTFMIKVDAGMVDKTKALLTEYRATPVVYIGSEFYASTMIYGYYKDFNIEITYQKYSFCSIEIEGLT